MNDNSEVDFEMLDRQLIALIGDEHDALANTANFVALLFGALPDINWLGIYVLRGNELVLGPFQGKPACIRLPVGQGVCGTAARELQSLRVRNVQEFAGHIACDPASKSEVVVPLVIDGQLAGVLDIDSPRYGRFSARDQRGLESLCETFTASLASKGTTASEFI
ncbi:MAG: GAF domain-containing protein [Woeseiaceae bacterium]